MTALSHFDREFRPPVEWNQADNQFGTVGLLRVYLPFIIVLVATPYLVERFSPYLIIPVGILLGAFAHKMTIVMHDCCHLKLFRHRIINQIVGRLTGCVLGTDHDAFTRIHWLHHRAQGQTDDPQGKDYLGLRKAAASHLWFKLLSPFWGGDMFKLAMFNSAETQNKQSSAKSEANHAISDRWRYLKYPSIFLTQSTIAIFASGFGTNWWLILVYPISAATFGLFFSKIRSVVEHIPADKAPCDQHVRTHLPNLIDALLIFDLNFNYHAEHHLYPGVASKYLPNVHDRLKKDGYFGNENLSKNVFSTLVRRIRQASS